MLARITVSALLYLLLYGHTLWKKQAAFELSQNMPVQVGELVTYTIKAASSDDDIPMIAWDFGDGSGLGRYRKSLTATHRYAEPGVYQVFARIQGEDIPVTVTQTVYNPVTTLSPSRSSTICMDTLRNHVWVVNQDNNSVSCIDMEKNVLLREIKVGRQPRTLALDDEGNVWVASERDASISVVSHNGIVSETIELPYGSKPFGICFDPRKEFCYITLQGTGTLLKIHVDTRQVIQRLDVGRFPRGIAITSDGSKLLVTQFISPENNGVVRIVDAVSMQVDKEVELAFDETPDFEDRGRGVPNYISTVTISPDGSQAWIPSKKDNTARGRLRDGNDLTFDNTVRTIVSRIDLAEGKEARTFRTDINDADMACAVEFSPYGNIAFVALQGNNKISMIDVATNARLGLLDTTGLAPQGLVFNPNGTRLYVHNFMSRTVRVFNTENIILSNNFVPVVQATIRTINTEVLAPEVLLGKQIFYNADDERMTFAGYISCATCHLDGGSDERVWDFTERGEGLRNTHSLHGRAGTGMGNVHWTANFDEIQDFENDIRNEFGGRGFLPDSLFYKGTVSDPLGDPKSGLSRELDALAAYVHSLDKVPPSPYRNPDGSLTQDAVEGKIIFVRADCGSCHSGGAFTDRISGAFHDVGTISPSSGKRRNTSLTGIATPTLKGIWETAPYLHDGSAATLRDVLITKNPDKKHGDLTRFSEKEIEQLITYLLQIDENEAPDFPTSYSRFMANPIKLSPNPASGKVRLQWASSDFSGEIKIYQSNGSLLHTRKVQKQKDLIIDVSDFAPGLYIVDCSDGLHKSTSKLIIE